ncbi:MAG: MBOAT family protein [Flavobacteriales bacterium]|nr:MBOAT family protein [Flavobacteriales bacterium]
MIFIYHAIPHRHRWKLLLAGSYYFYMCWKIEYVVLILLSTMVDYWAAIRMSEKLTKDERRPLLYLSLFVNLGLLFFFKYYNFVSENIEVLFSQFNIFYNMREFDLLLPVGISFYTFQTLSYSIDVYRGHAKAERHLGYFALYVSYFPQLVAGPIERSSSLIPQLRKNRQTSPNDLRFGVYKILLGFFKKLVLADTCAHYVDLVFGNTAAASGIQVFIAMNLFAVQIYGDFSGYTDIAIGSARLMGIRLMENFNKPMWVRSFSEFWNKWHISLTKWIEDYMHLPLLNVIPKWKKNLIYNAVIIMLVMLAIGLWHGAKWTFVVFGLYNAVMLIIQTGMRKMPFFKKLRNNKAYEFFLRVSNWYLLVFGIAFFRAQDIEHAFLAYSKLFTDFRLSLTEIFLSHRFELVASFTVSIIALLIIYNEKHLRLKYKWVYVVGMILMILLLGQDRSNQFIYFQF